jgi:hypothetical protein
MEAPMWRQNTPWHEMLAPRAIQEWQVPKPRRSLHWAKDSGRKSACDDEFTVE